MEVDHKLQVGIGRLDGSDEAADLGGVGDADGVAQAAGLHAGVHIVLQELHRPLRLLVLALKGAAEGGGQVHDDVQVGELPADLLIGLQRLLMGAVDVGLVVALAQGDHIAHLPQAQGVGVLGAPEVGDQGEEVGVGVLGQGGAGDLGGVGQLGDGLGADKGGKLHVTHTGVDEGVDDGQLLFCGNEAAVGFDALEPVAGAHFNDLNFFLHVYAPYV